MFNSSVLYMHDGDEWFIAKVKIPYSDEIVYYIKDYDKFYISSFDYPDEVEIDNYVTFSHEELFQVSLVKSHDPYKVLEAQKSILNFIENHDPNVITQRKSWVYVRYNEDKV